MNFLARTSLRCFVAVACLSLAPLGDPPPEQAVAAQALAKSGKKDEAYAKVLEGLEYLPRHPLLLDLAANYAHDLDKNDEAFWYAQLGIQQTASVKEAADLAKDLSALAAKIDPLAADGPSPIASWSNALFDLAKTCNSHKLYVNAVDLLTRLDRTPIGDKAEAELQKIYANKPAVAILLESGLDVPLKSKRTKRSPEQIARDDAKHNTWDTRWKLKGDNYTIETDMGGDFADSVSSAMEQMNRFYRSVFAVKQNGGKTARVTIKLYRSRHEFDEHETEGGKPIAPEVRGFYANNDLKVATYDHRTDGLGLAFTWSTLFHESSHQFTALIAVDIKTLPAWLNEGTASYFEGARLLANGSIETNLVAERRLKPLVESVKSGKPSLKDVVSFAEGGSYPGEDYPVGWGLVYFLHNYEDESGARPYLPLYQEFMVSYRTGGGKEAFPRFVEYFVTKAKQAGITKFEDFEARFKKWILELDDLYFGPPEKADLLIERARREKSAKLADYAIESYRWALRKRPGDALANAELGDLFGAQKDKDHAFFHWRAALAALSSSAEPTAKVLGPTDVTVESLAKSIQDKMVALDKDFAGALNAASTKFEAAIATSAKSLAEKAFPISALYQLEVAEDLCGKPHSLRAAYDEIAQSSKASTDRWHHVATSSDLAGWEAGNGWTADANGVSNAGKSGLTFCQWKGDLEPHFRFDVKVEADFNAETDVVGVIYSANDNALHLAAIFGDGRLMIAKLDEKLEHLGVFPDVPKDKLKSFVFGVERFDDHFDFYVDDVKVGTRKATDNELHGDVGVFVQACRAKFSALRVRQ